MRVTYSISRGTLRVRIKVPKLPPGVYNTGISVQKSRFDKQKQICGTPEIQLYMNKVSKFMESAFRPGMVPSELWTHFVQEESAKKIHTLKEAFDYYFMESVIAKSTRASINDTMVRAERAGILYMDIRDITPAVVSKFVGGMGVSASTGHKHFRWIRSVLNRYINAHQLNINIDLSHAVKQPKRSEYVKPGEESYLTLEEVRKLMVLPLPNHIAYSRDMFCLMAFTGMAIRDLSLFNPDMVDKDGWLVYSRKKTGKTCEIPLIAQAKEIIAKHKWPMKISTRTMQSHCVIIGQAIGKNIPSHSGRRSFGCIALELGFSMDAVSKMMGHSSIRTTESIYAKVTRDKIQREMRELPEGMKSLMNQPLIATT